MVIRKSVLLSDAPTPHLSQWWDEKFEMRYRNTLSKCSILLEHRVTWIEFHEIGITRAIRALGWK